MGGKDEGWPVWTGIERLFRYHWGSLFFGAFFVAIVQFIRTIGEYLCSKFEDSVEKGGKCAAFVKKCVCCCLWFLEKCLKWASRNAYIEMAIWGDSFCVSGCRGLTTLMED